jgi:hypothetical protein
MAMIEIEKLKELLRIHNIYNNNFTLKHWSGTTINLTMSKKQLLIVSMPY